MPPAARGSYEVRVRTRFHACHAVRTPGGPLEPLHWHRWGVEARFAGEELDGGGLLVDFEEARRRLAELTAPLEGTNLNRHPFLAGEPASAEWLARRLFEALGRGGWGGARLARVTVTESEGCSASFTAARIESFPDPPASL